MRRLLSIFYCLLFPVLSLSAQQAEWIAMTHSGYLVRAEYADTDKNGNCYVAGICMGENEFGSSTSADSSIRTYSSEHWHKSFIAKYSPQGRLLFLIRLQSNGGNSNLTYIRDLKCMSNGDIVISMHSPEFTLWTPDSVYSRVAGGYKMILIRFSPEGKLLWTVKLHTENCDMLQADSDNNCWAIMDESYGKKRHFARFNKDGNITRELPIGDPAPHYYRIQDRKLWMLTVERGKSVPYVSAPGIVKLMSLDILSDKEEKHFEITVPSHDKVRFSLRFRNNTPLADMWFGLDKDFSYKDISIVRDRNSSILLRLDEKGKVLNQLMLGIIPYYNFNVIPGNADQLYLMFPAYRNFSVSGGDSVIIPVHSGEFINELYCLRIGKDYKPEALINGGGIASNYHLSHLLVQGNYLYLISDLLDYGNLPSGYTELRWRAGYYVQKLKE